MHELSVRFGQHLPQMGRHNHRRPFRDVKADPVRHHALRLGVYAEWIPVSRVLGWSGRALVVHPQCTANDSWLRMQQTSSSAATATRRSFGRERNACSFFRICHQAGHHLGLGSPSAAAEDPGEHARGRQNLQNNLVEHRLFR